MIGAHRIVPLLLGPPGLNEEENSLLNRHVDCRAAESADDYLWADMLKDANGVLTGNVASASADPATTESVQVASVRFEIQVSTAGPSNGKRGLKALLTPADA